MRRGGNRSSKLSHKPIHGTKISILIYSKPRHDVIHNVVGRRLPGSFFRILSYIKEGKNNDLLFSYSVKNSGLTGKLKSPYFVVFDGPHIRKAFKEFKGFICLLNKGCCCFVSEFFRYVFLDRYVISLSSAS